MKVTPRKRYWDARLKKSYRGASSSSESTENIIFRVEQIQRRKNAPDIYLLSSSIPFCVGVIRIFLLSSWLRHVLILFVVFNSVMIAITLLGLAI
ncbi:hypothetical protein [Citrobacter freundii]|uniref:Uncharacterized protein n=1 Tax=Citrobacter freundii TaxID=546 RepID=A0A7G2IJK0_CITFR|nr:hypothetical protein [Citrobacter freundii]